MAANKFGARKVTIDNHTFDSVAESKYYEQLKWMLQGKQIKSFKLQPRFLLQEAFTKNGMNFKKIEYVADFEIHNLDGSVEIIDVKGHETKDFLIKRKLFENRYEHSLKIITLDNSLGWMELDQLKKLKKKVKPNAKAKTATVGYPHPRGKGQINSSIRATPKKGAIHKA
jgi:hypothetical protein